MTLPERFSLFSYLLQYFSSIALYRFITHLTAKARLMDF